MRYHLLGNANVSLYDYRAAFFVLTHLATKLYYVVGQQGVEQWRSLTLKESTQTVER